MSKISLEKTYYFAEIIAAIAVVISLIYVGLQVQQNTKAVRISSLQNATQELRELYIHWGRDAEMADIIARGVEDFENLSRAEKIMYYSSLHLMMHGYENSFFQAQESALSEQYWQAAERVLVDLTKIPGVLSYWELRKPWFTADFQRYMDEEVFPVGGISGYKLAGT